MRESAPPDYLLIGHITRDAVAPADSLPLSAAERAAHAPRTWRAGGTVLYAGVTAHRLGRRVGIVTASGPDFARPPELERVDIVRAPSPATTTFEIDLGSQRSLRLIDRAADLRVEDVPASWRSAPLVHLAPVAGEVPFEMASAFPRSWVGATPQGWLRQGGVGQWSALPGIAAAVLSTEDLPAGADRELTDGERRSRYRMDPPLGRPSGRLPMAEAIRDAAEALGREVPLVVLTRGADGCIVVDRGQVTEVDAYLAHEVDSTGAGDVFAAGFFVRLSETSDPVESAHFAAHVAALSVEGVGTSRIPTRAQVAS